MALPDDYIERVYAGVLGKIIGVYLGRPIENWTYEQIGYTLGVVDYYVHDKLNVPLVVTDDDIAGTFTFIRALSDRGNPPDLTARQIGQTWLNYLIENRTILWWGGFGNSTEHTAFLRLKHGIPAPHSGSIAMNGSVVAEQIGAQIFIDGWAMVAPGDPELASDLARKASSVSHDGEAVNAAQLLAAMESMAFVEPDLNAILDAGLRFIPKNSIVYRLVNDLRSWHASEPDWRKTRVKIENEYGYTSFAGNCPIIPNSALIHLGLLYGDNDFQRTLMIVNTCGWDTDCNSGNAGCLMGIKNGLAGINHGPDWRTPVADQLYLPRADGGRCISDAVRETYAIANIGRTLAGETPLTPKQGARFHFELPGSVQGFRTEQAVESTCMLTLTNATGHSRIGARSLGIHYYFSSTNQPGWIFTPTFIPSQDVGQSYELVASPTLYPGQTIEACLEADHTNAGDVEVRLAIKYFGVKDALQMLSSPPSTIKPGELRQLFWTVPDLGGLPVQSVGLELQGTRESTGTLYLDFLTWNGVPKLQLKRPTIENTFWRRAWVCSVDHWESTPNEAYHLSQDEGRGMLMQGTREWAGYTAKAQMSSFLATSFGVAGCVQGLCRYYALLLCRDGKARLVKALDGWQVLREVAYPLQFHVVYEIRLRTDGNHLKGWVDGKQLFDLVDDDMPLVSGATALFIEEGTLLCENLEIS